MGRMPINVKLHRRRRRQLQWLQGGATAVLGLACLLTVKPGKNWLNQPHAVASIGLITIFAVIALVFAMNLVAKRRTRWRLISSVSSLLLLAGILVSWSAITQRNRDTVGFGELVGNKTDTDSLLKKYLKPGANPIRVPTGFFVQSLEFTSGTNVDVTGYIWQRYADSVPANIERGFVLPEALEAYQVTEAYRSKKDGYTVIGWYFHALLRQSFFYHQYPLDRQDIWLRIWHKNFEQGAILVPDFDSFPQPFLTANKNGLDREFRPEGWKIEYTSFNYNNIVYNSSFGLGDYRPGKPFPELYFCIGIERNFGGPLITRIIPMAVVSTLLYAVLIATRKSSKGTELVGFNTFAVLSYCAALFFVVVVDHAGMKSFIGQSTFCYLDCFYFIIYGAILLVSVNSLLLTNHRRNVMIIEYGDNLIPKYMFWPLVLGSVFGATVWMFG